MPIFDRLAGLETEYAMRFRPLDEAGPVPSKFRLYQGLIDSVRRRVLVVAARHFKEGIFTANGGAVWFEAERPAAGAGLIEGATPECRGPRQLLTYQRAQDRLLGDAAKAASLAGEFCLIKNDRDGFGNIYGAQENYEATIATGWRLWLWRVGLAGLLPLLLLTWLGLLGMVLGMLLYLMFAGLAYLVLQFFVREPKVLACRLFGGDLVERQETGVPMPAWMESSFIWLTRFVTGPLAVYMLGLCWLAAFSTTRRQLMPFLVSRAVIAGSGMIDEEGRFHLADKGPALNCSLGYGGFLNDRPIFTMGHFLKAVCGEGWCSFREYGELFSARQRLQIALGDSNMSEAAEFLRIGTTMLVLDAIEAGALPNPPRVVRPIRALHTICADPTLSACVQLSRGRRVTALQLQRFYLDGCRRFVAREARVPHEAREVLRLWEDSLNALEERREDPTSDDSVSPLMGRLDWFTKQHLLDTAGKNANWSARKKIDIRYHELSPDGYFQLLKAVGVAPTLVEPEELARAVRTPPPDTPATTRGHYIREFSESTQPISVNWKRVVIGRGRGAKTIHLAHWGRRAALLRGRRDERSRRNDAEAK